MTMKTTSSDRTNSYNMKTPTVIPATYVSNPVATSPIKINYRKGNSDKSNSGMRSTDNYDNVSVASSSLNLNNGRKSNEFEYAEIDRLIKEEKFEEIFTNVIISSFIYKKNFIKPLFIFIYINF